MDDLLQAATRVLVREGAAAFTTNRVAEVAGVSIGSLYQYFPNKGALLLALHERDATASWLELESVLSDGRRTPKQRVELLVRRFFEMEAGAVEAHVALAEARAFVAKTAEFAAFETRVVERLRVFIATSFPRRKRDAAFLASFVFTVVTATGERLATRRLTGAEIEKVASTMARAVAALLS